MFPRNNNDLWTLLLFPIIITFVGVSVQHDNNSNPPKILVTGRTASSLALAWDDFRQPTYDQGYIVEYRSKLNQSDTEGASEPEPTPLGIDKWLRIQANNTPFMVLDGLMPHQDYLIRIQVWDDRDKNRLSLVQSETITATTLDGCFAGPAAAASSSTGHTNSTSISSSSANDQGHKQTYEIGQVFFDGCAFKCTCREGGISECEERCPVYIDGIGYEHCEWMPSPDDECCKIPVCKQPPPPPPPEPESKTASEESGTERPALSPSANQHPHVTFPPMPTRARTEEPSTLSVGDDKEHFVPESRHHQQPPYGIEPFCLVDNGQMKSVGEHWIEAGGACLRKNCSCVLLNNGSTTVDCEGGCAAIPAEALRPTVECPRPELVTPDDPCLCPYVVCNSKTINLPPTLPSSNGNQRDRPSSAATITSTTASFTTTNSITTAATPLAVHNVEPPIDFHSNSSTAPSTGHHHDGAAADREGSTVAGKRYCDFRGRQLAIGEEIHDGCKAICHCDQDADLSCALIECPHHFSPHASECLEWDIDPEYEAEPPNCCPTPKCKNDGSCQFAGLTFANFKHIPDELLPCGTRCACVNGNITCENRCPPVTDIPPPSLSCPPQLAYRGHEPDGDSCCETWLCRTPDRPVFCVVNDKRFRINEQWDEIPPASNGLAIRTHRRCQCKAGPKDGMPIVECRPGSCPQITERHLRPSPECPVPVVVQPEDPAVMCPYVVCNHSGEEPGKDLDRVSVVAINASAVRVRFTLPQILIGLVGHAELHYTSDPNLPREQWGVQKFARPKRLFDTANIEYHLGRLLPDTVYYFQIRVLVEALQGGPESEIYRLKMPALPTTSTTTTTTTLPPVMLVDAHMNAIPLDYSSATVAWRQLEAAQRKLVDGIQLKYKRVEESDHDWVSTPMIHRDLTSYILRDLQPGMSYLIDIVYRTGEHLSVAVLSARPIMLEMPAKPRDEYEFHVSIEPNDVLVDSSRSVFKLRGAPQPANKFITVAKISYRTADGHGDNGQMVHTFRVPTDDGTIVLDGLKPRNRYKAWIDLYLANGKRITSNIVDFQTKDGKIDHRADRPDDQSANEAEAFRDGETTASKASVSSEDIRPYYIALTIVALFATVTGVGFVTLLCVLLRNKSSAKAPITRAPSESAYDNPTYKASSAS